MLDQTYLINLNKYVTFARYNKISLLKLTLSSEFIEIRSS